GDHCRARRRRAGPGRRRGRRPLVPLARPPLEPRHSPPARLLRAGPAACGQAREGRRGMSPAGRAGASLLALLAASGCTANRIERGVFHSKKGYEVSLPGSAWQVAPSSKADLELKRAAPPGGMLAAATCGERVAERSPETLVRFLVFGLTHRSAGG